MTAPTLTFLILAVYAASVWHLLRDESPPWLWSLALLCSLSVVLRVAYTNDFPPGLNEDEPKILYCTFADLGAAPAGLFREGCTGLPVLLNALFQAQLVPL